MIRRMTLGIVVAAIGGCQFAPPAADTEGVHVLTGVVIRKEWSKSLESWSAGGSEYYVLKVDGSDLPPAARTAKEGVILLPSKTVPFAYFNSVVGLPVVCRGQFVAGERYLPPKDSVEQIPGSAVNSITRESEYPVVGAGFRVQVIDPVVK